MDRRGKEGRGGECCGVQKILKIDPGFDTVGWVTGGGASGLQKIPHQQLPKFLLWNTYAGPGLSWSKV